MKLALRPNALLCLVSLLAACGTDAASRDRTQSNGDDTNPINVTDTGSSDSSSDTDGSGDADQDTTADGSGAEDTSADTSADTAPDGSSDTGTVEPVCGDGTVDDGESCDEGVDNSDTAPDRCRTDCLPASCGDGVLDSGESCDDGNLTPQDGCDANCKEEVSLERLCTPCVSDASCGSAFSCVTLDTFICTLDCSTDGLCPADYTCLNATDIAGGPGRFCIPDAGSCAACEDLDGDGRGPTASCIAPDCNDNNNQIFVGAPERCDGLDNNCDGATDTGCSCIDGNTTPCGLTEGTCELGTQTCAAGVWGACVGGIEPAAERCDGLDNDCDGTIDDFALDAIRYYRDADGDGAGAGTSYTLACGPDRTFTVTNDTDCDDTRAAVRPGLEERCDGLDNDCNAATVDGRDELTIGTSCDGADLDLCPEGRVACAAATLTCDEPAGDALESCDGLDNDCDGSIDEGVIGAPTWYRDADRDGAGGPAVTTTACTAPTGYVATATDCDDTRITVYPGAAELCADGLDNNCDTFFDCADTSCASLPNCQVVEICNNALDDDGDGLIDCLDSGCAAEPACAVGTCLDFDLGSSVGDAVALDTIAFAAGAATSNDTNTTCGGAVSSDRGYLWNAPRAGTYTFSISAADYIWVLSIRPPSCTAVDYLCAAQDTLVGPGISRFFRAGEQTLIAVDGLAGAEGTFTLNINPSEAGACTDATDNDGDTKVDCADSDCATDAACPELCADGLDNNANGLIDCADPSCAAAPLCISTYCPIGDLGSALGTPVISATTAGSTNYFTGVCGNAAGPELTYTWTAPRAGAYRFDTRPRTSTTATDTVLYIRRGVCTSQELGCDDDIASAGTGTSTLPSEVFLNMTAGEQVTIVVDSYYAAGGAFDLTIANSETGACRDGVDSDGDLLVDCYDPDCYGSNAAGTCTEICNDGIDNNANGQLDCLDSACSLDRWCDEVCTDGRDNDGDALVDCADPDCSTNTACIEVCTDGIDNDTDGLVDCRDPSCVADAACLEICTGGRDEDLDGLVDCRDPDCSANAACPENCTNGIDDDANSLVDCVDPDCRLTGTCCIQDLLENNDAIATATPIAAWQARMGTAVTVSTGDDDFYAVPVCAGVTVQASLNFVNANGNIDLELRNATGASVLAFSRSLANNSETITYNAVRTETLYLRAAMVSALSCSSYTYTFTIIGSCP